MGVGQEQTSLERQLKAGLAQRESFPRLPPELLHNHRLKWFRLILVKRKMPVFEPECR
jgi:hypothetical protein